MPREGKTQVAVVGASGYTGAELIRLILGHPDFQLVHVSAGRSAGSRMADVFPHLAGDVAGAVQSADPDAIAEAAELAFLALPHGASAGLGAQLRERGLKVVDLSADFRLRDLDVYQSWYGEHQAPQRMAEAVYGMPERYRDAIRGAALVASPGCYPTSAILAAAPLLDAGLIRPTGLVVDAKSGVTGAGRKTSQTTLYAEVAEGLRAYKVGGTHRHTPEMEQELGAAAGTEVRVLFTPHLVPMNRGILACIYAEPADGDRPSSAYRDALAAAYEGEPFVTVLDGDALPSTSFVRGSNRVQVAVRHDQRSGRVLVMSAIDNLVKGAAGQALQSANLMLGLDETSGLTGVPAFP